tara:strand:- start:902 stop:1729 length:828 start_codon:yes stop_codon:yes gene_type:complete
VNIIGLGDAGSALANSFSNYAQYKIFSIASEDKGYSNFIHIANQETHEDYEKNYKNLNLRKCKGDITLILSGASKISGCALRLLEQMKDRSVTILYIKPDNGELAGEKRLYERATYGILQQYVRSAALDMMYVVCNKNVEDILESVSLQNYWQDMNNVISSTYHMINVFKNTEPLLNSMPQAGVTSNIRTLGVVNYETKKEKLLYDLQYPRARKYFFGLSSNRVESDKDALHDIRCFIQNKADDNIDSGFSIYSTSYDINYVYSEHCASFIQEYV